MDLAARYYGSQDVRVEEVPDQTGELAPDGLRLRVATAGICGSDAAEFTRGPLLAAVGLEPHPVSGHTGPVTLGHEFSGIVEAVGEAVEGFAPGMLVSCGAGVSCGGCGPCRARRTNLCESYATIGLHWHGGLAQHCTVPAATCRDAGAYGLTADAAALAQPMSIALHALRRGRPAAGERVLVIGAGGIGAFLVYLAAREGCEVVVADRSEERLGLAREMGATETIAVAADEPLRVHPAPLLVFEVSGSAAGLESAFRIVPPGSRIVAVGLQSGPVPLDWRWLTLSEIELIGTVAHVCATDLPDSLAAIADRAEGWSAIAPEVLPLRRLVEDGLRPLSEGRPAHVKTLIDPWIAETRLADTVPRRRHSG